MQKVREQNTEQGGLNMPIHAASAEKSEQLQLILHTLREYGPSTTKTLSHMSGSMCVGTRVSELRSQGFNIDCQRKAGKFWYTLQ